jgi:hypothetical protein
MDRVLLGAGCPRAKHPGPLAHWPRSDTIYVSHMPRQKTTLYLESGDYRRLKALAGAKGVAPAQLVREAVAEYVARHDVRRRPGSIGRFASKRSDLSERAEELLAGLPRR